MAQTDTLPIRGLTAIPGDRTHHGFESLRPIGTITTKIFSHIDPRPIVPALGAEISGIDLRQPSLEAQGELREVLADRKVLVFRLVVDINQGFLENIRRILLRAPVLLDMTGNAGGKKPVDLFNYLSIIA